jgi:hypothetical protein
MNNQVLSIVLPTTFDRRKTFYPLLEFILRQINNMDLSREIEVLIDEDNKEKSIGQKRQDLLQRANGKYIVGIDSDDWISDDYIKKIYKAITNNPEVDHIGFYEKCNIDGDITKSIFSIKYLKWHENLDGYDHIRCANPKSVIKREIAIKVGFEDIRYGEDRIFSEKVTPLLSTEIFIDDMLYYYRRINSEHNHRYGII